MRKILYFACGLLLFETRGMFPSEETSRVGVGSLGLESIVESHEQLLEVALGSHITPLSDGYTPDYTPDYTPGCLLDGEGNKLPHYDDSYIISGDIPFNDYQANYMSSDSDVIQPERRIDKLIDRLENEVNSYTDKLIDRLEDKVNSYTDKLIDRLDKLTNMLENLINKMENVEKSDNDSSDGSEKPPTTPSVSQSSEEESASPLSSFPIKSSSETIGVDDQGIGLSNNDLDSSDASRVLSIVFPKLYEKEEEARSSSPFIYEVSRTTCDETEKEGKDRKDALTSGRIKFNVDGMEMPLTLVMSKININLDDELYQEARTILSNPSINKEGFERLCEIVGMLDENKKNF
jgi:uncharacterized coiled-coil protein SlyX